MTLFIWDSVDELTDNYHSTGGVVVIAENLEAAKAAVPYTKLIGGKESRVLGEPTASYDVGDVAAQVFVFPNAGCC